MKKNCYLWRFWHCMLIAALVAGISACSSGGGGTSNNGNNVSTSVRLSGSIAPGGAVPGYNIAMSAPRAFYAKALSVLGLGAFAYAAPSDPTVDMVLALPMPRGSLTSWNMENSVTGTINSSDGSFSLLLSKDTDWLLVLINSAATGTSRYVGSVALDLATSDSLLNLPVTEAAVDALALGTVSRETTTSGDAVSSATVTASTFNMTADQLETMAKNDDLFRNAMNIVNNYGSFGNGATVWYQLRPDFSWLGDYAALTAGFSDPDMAFKGMSFQLDTNSTSVTMDMICQGTTTLKLIPPAAISDGLHTYDPANPITNAGATCTALNSGRQASGTSFYATDIYGGKMSYGVPADFTTVPAGDWIWEESGATKAVFNVKTANPPLTDTNSPNGFVPAFKINVDGTSRILSVDIHWYYYDPGTASYAGPLQQQDLTILKHFIQSAEVKFDRTYQGARYTDEIYFDPSTTSQVIPTKEWYYGTHPADPAKETGLMGFYESGGFGYFFSWFNPNMTP